jgi:hypothetical protein
LFVWKKTVLPIADEKTIHLPSGDHAGPLSGPGCETIFLTVSSARFRT